MKYYRPKEICSICNKNAIVVKKTNEGVICEACYEGPKHICIKCGEMKAACIKDGNNIICYNCRRKDYMQTCSKCGKNKGVAVKDENKNPICSDCYTGMCIICNTEGVVKKRTENGIICSKCYERPKSECFICKKVKIIKAIKNGQKLCRDCHMEKCIVCEKNKTIYARTEKGCICPSCFNKIRCDKDENYRILKLLRTRLYEAFKFYSETGKTKHSDEYEIDYGEIIDCLQPFPQNIKEYHIDHIFPLSAFDFDDLIQIRAAFAPENHQWLKAEDNMIKNAKYNENDFEEYLKKFRLED